MKPSDRMLQGSVGKTYVAAVALQLVSEGKLSLDAKIETWLGKEAWFSRLPNARDITVRMLMRHQSGLVRYEFKPEFTRDLVAKPDRTWKPEELVAFLLDEKAPFAAGKGWDYSDTNYIVLGMIVERATGSSLNAEIRRRLLKPLELIDTVASDRRRIPGLVQGYAGEHDPLGLPDRVLVDGEMVINPQFEWAGGGWASTSADLARWAHALYGGRVLDAARTAEMLDAVDAPMLGRGAKYGLGVIVRPEFVGHSGFFPGYLTEMWYSPEKKAAIALQLNTSAQGAFGKSPVAVVRELFDAL
jgi:D-alanyl-D-alanine carboxypeptidase